MATGDSRTKDDRRLAVLDAAREFLRSADLAWSRVLTYDTLEELSGIDRAQIAKDFSSKDELSQALREFLLRPSEQQTELIEGALDLLPGMLADENTSLAEIVHAFGEVSRTQMIADDNVYTHMTLWGMAARDPESSKDLRSLFGYFESINGRSIELIYDHIEAAGYTMRPEFTRREAAVIVGAFVQGLLLREGLDPGSVPEDLRSRVLPLLLGAMISKSPDDPPVWAILDDL